MAGVVAVNLIAGLVIALILVFPGPDDPPPEQTFLTAVQWVTGGGGFLVLSLIFLKWLVA